MEPTDRNRRAWEAAHRRRRRDAPPPGLPELVRSWLPDVRGRHVLQLPAGNGDVAADLVALGALVTALDRSEAAVAAARARVPAAAVVHGDPHAPPPELLRGRFQLAYAGEGALAQIDDLGAAARALAASLRGGGFVVFYDEHPAAPCVDALRRWRGTYFGGSAGHALGDIVTAVAQAGFTVRRLEELPSPLGDPHVPGRFALVARK